MCGSEEKYHHQSRFEPRLPLVGPLDHQGWLFFLTSHGHSVPTQILRLFPQEVSIYCICTIKLLLAVFISQIGHLVLRNFAREQHGEIPSPGWYGELDFETETSLRPIS